ncbi:PAS domain S-box-containing protein [Halorubrum alkaliphilum]|uniref:histidine kinase n=2 Tax=Halorubrum alkaliphilum TaxID=261290 RepID=A0A8T4GB49_9EURY|nr:PAS domain S-box protein [Halorubrum alkaliphilum]MBP1921323.1 PAS domain S-box-containing protein [Halorubrum alkaliphilum]
MDHASPDERTVVAVDPDGSAVAWSSVAAGVSSPEEPFPDGFRTERAEPIDPSEADAFVVMEPAALDRVRETNPTLPVVALVDDPTQPVAAHPLVDSIATDPDGVETQVEWLSTRTDADPVRTSPSSAPSRIERLGSGATRLATVRDVDTAYRTTVAVADEVFPEYDVVIGVSEDGWIEPVAVSADVALDECQRVRAGRGSAGTVIERGEPIVTPRRGDESNGHHITVPVDDDTVLQISTDDPGGFADEDGRLVELLASHLEETLDRIRTDDELRAERDRLLALFENVPDPAVAYDDIDGEPRFRRVNSAFEETFGYDPESIVGESIDEYMVPDEVESRSEAEELNAKLRRGENVRREVTRETADGERHFILHVIPIHLDAENVSGYAIYTDVTARREREATLRRQNERLEQFSSIVSHDLRNPLSVAEGYVDLARETSDLDHLERVDEALTRMDRLVEDLLSLAREGEVVGDIESVSLDSLAREAWASVDTSDARLLVEDDVELDANPTRARELLENLFRNSVEHGRSRDGDAVSRDDENSAEFSNHSTSSRTKSDDSVEHGSTSSRAEPGDSVEHGRSRDSDTVSRDDEHSAEGSNHTTAAESDAVLTVRVGGTTLRDGDTEGFYVEDDGHGLPEDADRIFETGFTTDEDGTGLGLAIVERIAEAHGWTIRATTGEDGGARFEFGTG